MKKILSVIAMVSALGLATTACTQTDQQTAGYGIGGAALGALAGGAIGGDGRGALAGAALGGLAGSFIGYSQHRDGVQYCKYRNNRGAIIEAPCK